MKHVWILNHYAQQPSAAGGTRHFHLAEYLKDYGWSASIIAASVEHQTGIQRLRSDENYRIEVHKDITFLWLRTPAYSGNKFRRVLNIAAYFFQALRPSRTKKLSIPNAIIGSSVHPLAALAGMILSRKLGVPFIFEVRDLWPQTLIDMGRLKESSILTWILRKMELYLYRQAARVVVLLPSAWEYIVPLGISKQKIIWIPNGVDLSMFTQTPDPIHSDDFTLMYFGAHGHANGLWDILQAMSFVQQSSNGAKINLRLIGEGSLKPLLIAESLKLGLKNIFFESSVPKNEISALASKADAFVLSVIDLPNLYKYGISMNKMFDYLAASRPILIASNAINNPVADAHAGITVAPGNPQALAEAILKIASTSLEERIRMGRAGRDYVKKNHDFVQLSAKLATVLNEVCAEVDNK